ncbi:hypothetical protein HBA94_10885 [Ochrobactrum sp. GRS2]|nr:hypothetical protein [Ochrobactrum sp. GRS2]
MAYAYYIINTTNSTYLRPILSTANNTYINYDMVGLGSQTPPDEGIWVTNASPTGTAIGYSSDLTFYNPCFDIFLGNAEQPRSLSAPYSNINGTLAGSFTFTQNQNATTFVVKSNGSNSYKILMKPPSNTDNSALKNSLIVDISTSLITIADFDNIAATHSISDSWNFIPVTLP